MKKNMMKYLLLTMMIVIFGTLLGFFLYYLVNNYKKDTTNFDKTTIIKAYNEYSVEMTVNKEIYLGDYQNNQLSLINEKDNQDKLVIESNLYQDLAIKLEDKSYAEGNNITLDVDFSQFNYPDKIKKLGNMQCTYTLLENKIMGVYCTSNSDNDIEDYNDMDIYFDEVN